MRGKKVLVVGLGKSGAAAALVLKRKGAEVVVNDIRSRDELPTANELAHAGIELALGAHDSTLFTSVDQIVVSPGVPPLKALDAADSAGVPIASEVEFASWFINSDIVAITGTNGKSTVTSMVGAMCSRTGRPTFVGGNLGTPLADVIDSPASEEGGFVVAELSSFQLERVKSFRAKVAVLLNVSADHLDRYKDFDDYASTKANIFLNQTASDHAVVPSDDPLCNSLVLGRERKSVVSYFAGSTGAVRVTGEGSDSSLRDDASGLLVPLTSLRIAGDHNVTNACAAALAARLAGVAREHIEDVLVTFPGLAHRMQWVRDLDGVSYYDDSKATNVGASVAALRGLEDRDGKVVLIAGGTDKGGGYGPLAAQVARNGRGVVLLGEASSLISGALDTNESANQLPRTTVSDMNDAVLIAREMARPGDCVLLAPACSSFDMFTSYAERGDVFQAAVNALHANESAVARHGKGSV